MCNKCELLTNVKLGQKLEEMNEEAEDENCD